MQISGFRLPVVGLTTLVSLDGELSKETLVYAGDPVILDKCVWTGLGVLL